MNFGLGDFVGDIFGAPWPLSPHLAFLRVPLLGLGQLLPQGRCSLVRRPGHHDARHA